MIGTVVFVGVSILEHVWDHNLASYVFVVLAAFIFCWGAFAAWGDTDKKLREEVLKHQGARLEGVIKRGYLDMRVPTKLDFAFMVKGCCITLLVEIVNHNQFSARVMPSRTSLEAVIQGRSYHGEWVHSPQGMLVVNDDTVKVKAISDFFDEMYYSSAIEQGEPRIGHIMFLVEDFDQEVAKDKHQLDADITITINDTLSKPHVVSASMPLMIGKMLSAEEARKNNVNALIGVIDLIRKQDSGT